MQLRANRSHPSFLLLVGPDLNVDGLLPLPFWLSYLSLDLQQAPKKDRRGCIATEGIASHEDSLCRAGCCVFHVFSPSIRIE